MIQQLQSVLATLCNMGGLLIVIAGGLTLAWGLLAHGGAGAFIKGGALILFGMWFSGLGR